VNPNWIIAGFLIGVTVRQQIVRSRRAKKLGASVYWMGEKYAQRAAYRRWVRGL
jgi:hypothetical protein